MLLCYVYAYARIVYYVMYLCMKVLYARVYVMCVGMFSASEVFTLCLYVCMVCMVCMYVVMYIWTRCGYGQNVMLCMYVCMRVCVVCLRVMLLCGMLRFVCVCVYVGYV